MNFPSLGCKIPSWSTQKRSSSPSRSGGRCLSCCCSRNPRAGGRTVPPRGRRPQGFPGSHGVSPPPWASRSSLSANPRSRGGGPGPARGHGHHPSRATAGRRGPGPSGRQSPGRPESFSQSPGGSRVSRLRSGCRRGARSRPRWLRRVGDRQTDRNARLGRGQPIRNSGFLPTV